ncbi:hypothetical protein ACLB2K_038531 [Fragaria x ananassa]
MAVHHTSIDMEFHDCTKCKKLCKKCIFKVPKVLRRQNSEAYTPDVVSIGPFHRRGKGRKGEKECEECKNCKKCKECKLCKKCKKGKEGNEEEFQLMERVKESYLNEVFKGMMMSTEMLTAKVIELSDRKNEGTIGFEQRARGFYAEPPLDISSEEFIKMMIVDGCFLIQLFRKCNDPTLRDIEDPVFNMDCIFHFLCHDLLLLENQLPWFVLEILYSLIIGNCCSHKPSLAFLILEAFITLPSLKRSCDSYKQHLSSCHGSSNGEDVLHILDLVRSSIVIPSKVKARKENKVHEAMFDPEIHEMHTATALSKAGIKFKGVKSDSIMDIQFENGVFTFPQLNIGTLADSLFRNLIAFEQCYNGYSNEITSYAICLLQ